MQLGSCHKRSQPLRLRQSTIKGPSISNIKNTNGSRWCKTHKKLLFVSKIIPKHFQVVVTDKYPVDLHYVPHLDQVWVLNWRSENNTGIKTIQVIRDAGQKRKHHTVHPEPIDGQFDLVKGLYIPAANQEISHLTFKYGYVTHTNQRGLYKLDLSNLRYTKSVDLTPYNCVPAHIQFSALCKYFQRSAQKS